MKSKNVKSVSYAKGPKLPLFRNCSIAKIHQTGQLFPPISVGTFFFFWLLLETCKPQRGSTARFDSQWVATAFACMVLLLSNFVKALLAANKCLKFSASRQPQFSKSRTNFNLCIKQTENCASEAVHSCKTGYILKL